MLSYVFDIFLFLINLAVPIIGLIGVGVYVYKSKNVVVGIVLGWAFVIVFEVASFGVGLLLSVAVSRSLEGYFEPGRGIVVALLGGGGSTVLRLVWPLLQSGMWLNVSRRYASNRGEPC